MLLLGLLQTKVALSRFPQGCDKMGKKMPSLTNNSLYVFLPLPSLFMSVLFLLSDELLSVLWVTFKADINLRLYCIVQR